METNNPTPPVRPRARNRYAHLYMPFVTTALILANPHMVRHLAQRFAPQWDGFLWVAFSTLLTFIVGSQLYQADTLPSDGVRFTRRHEAIRALVLFTHGRWYGTPINLKSIIGDYVLSYIIADYLIGEPTRQRRSEFLLALVWVAGSGVLFAAIPSSFPQLSFVAGTLDRGLWRTAYLALVDDVVKVLSRPDVGTVRGRATLMLVQGWTIIILILGVRLFM